MNSTLSMKYYNKIISEKLGFEEIIQLLQVYCKTAHAKQRFSELLPFQNLQVIRLELQKTEELKNLLLHEKDFPFGNFEDLSPFLHKLSIENAVIPANEWKNLWNALKIFRNTQLYFLSHKDKSPLFFEYANQFLYDTNWVRKIEQVIDEDGKIKNNASPALLEIRSQYLQKLQILRNKLQKILRFSKQQGWSEDMEITIRNDRWVIPMKADFKGKIKGFVHDISHSGYTIFIEPTETLELNNELKELELKEEQEIRRILLELTDYFRNYLYDIQKVEEYLNEIDYYHAKAKLAIQLQAHLPQFSENLFLKIHQGRHPLLYLKNPQVVPLSIELNSKYRILLISGPNAGGKSVSLKTVGLLIWMLHCGLLVPCEESSHFFFMDRLFLSIGDDQSIQDDLSTYTSHLHQLKNMLQNLTARSLFLIDELGSGTDPLVGGAIAEAILEQFIDLKAFGVITTHFSNLKLFAEQNENVLNAAMMFEPKTLSPTYQLVQGIPGSSYAFEIAQKVGIPLNILDRAKNKIGASQSNLEELYLNLKTKFGELQNELQAYKLQNQELENLIQYNKNLKFKLEEERKKLHKEIRKQAQSELQAGISQVQKLLKEAKKHHKDLEKLKKIQEKLVEEEKYIQKELKEFTSQEPETTNEEIKVGDRVIWNAQVFEVLQISEGNATIGTGILKVQVKLKDLKKLKEPISFEAENPKVSLYTQNLNVKSELDLRGMRVEEAIKVLEKYLEDVMVSGLTYFRIIHGTGTGSLKIAVRQILKKYHHIVFRDEHADLGGSGVTVCEVKE
jgi:DNA mismatch repair protein MutS2